jgi:hypothetical protein
MAICTQSAADTGDKGHLNTGLWVAQLILLAAFGAAAWLKITSPIPQLAAMWPWTGVLPEPQVRLIGLIDLLGGIGVVLPTLTGVRPRVTVVAALGCATLQVCAMIFHISRGELAATPVNVVLLALALFVAWGRRGAAPSRC